MKKSPTPWANAQAEVETRIRQDQSEKVLAGLWRHIHLLERRAVDLLKSLDVLKASLPSPNATKAPEPAERKPVTATQSHIDHVYQVLCSTKPRYEALTAQNVADIWDATDKDGQRAGKRLAGAALKALVAAGRATVKRSKYAQVEPKAEPNGHAEATPAA